MYKKYLRRYIHELSRNRIGKATVTPPASIELRPFAAGWKVLDTPALEGDFIGGGAKEQALYYAKQRQQSNKRPILIFNSQGILIETIAAKTEEF